MSGEPSTRWILRFRAAVLAAPPQSRDESERRRKLRAAAKAAGRPRPKPAELQLPDDPTLSSTKAAVLFAMSQRCDFGTGRNCYLSADTIARWTKLQPSTVNEARAELVAAGWLEVQDERRGVTGRVKVYTLTIPSTLDLADLDDEVPADLDDEGANDRSDRVLAADNDRSHQSLPPANDRSDRDNGRSDRSESSVRPTQQDLDKTSTRGGGAAAAELEHCDEPPAADDDLDTRAAAAVRFDQDEVAGDLEGLRWRLGTEAVDEALKQILDAGATFRRPRQLNEAIERAVSAPPPSPPSPLDGTAAAQRQRLEAYVPDEPDPEAIDLAAGARIVRELAKGGAR